ncbi:MAG TPA: ANTAR domain-containing protein [Acetobacteraceae bacterium]|nr:ANTAR domain-containing protein [Acetobacteraceae bacterium]
MHVLLADDDAIRADALMRVLAAIPGVMLSRLQPGQLLVDAVAAHAPDVVIVDIARPDRDTLDRVRRVTEADPRPIVMFVDQDDPEFMEAAISAGVCSYNVAGLPPPDMRPILRAAIALFRRHKQARDELRTAQTRLEERGMVDRAKALLIRERRMTEPDAYRWLRRRAMASGRRIPEIARDLLHETPHDRPLPDRPLRDQPPHLRRQQDQAPHDQPLRDQPPHDPGKPLP